MENGNSYPGIRIDKLDSDTVVRFIDQGNDAVVISGTLNMGSHRIVKGADPIDGKDFATKDYVDQISGLVESSDVDSVNGLDGVLTIAGASGISVSDNAVDTITITGPDLSSFATISALNAVSGTLQSQIDGLTFDMSSVQQDVSDLQTDLSSLGSELVTVSGHLQEQIDGKSNIDHSHAHNSLSGLSDDDHVQYVPTNGSRGFTSVVSGTFPVMDFHLATKAYVDGVVFSLREELLSVSGSLQFEVDQLRNELLTISGSCCSGTDNFPAQYVSVDIASGEVLAKGSSDGSGSIDVGIANAWTISCWVKLDQFSSEGMLLNIGEEATSTFRNYITIKEIDSNGMLYVLTVDSSNTNLKGYKWGTWFSTGQWIFTVITWDGTTLKAYKNGSFVSPSSTPSNNSGTMTQTNHVVGIGNGGINDCVYTGSPADGKHHSYAVWNVALSSSSISELYNSGAGAEIDYAIDGTDYTNSANLLHWWRLGFDALNIGKDYGTHTTLIDVMTNAVGISAADIVSDFPGM